MLGVTAVAAAVICPLAALLMARVAVGPRMVGLLEAGVLSAGYMASFNLLLVWGPLFPYTLSVVLLPAALAVVVLACRMGASIVGAPARVYVGLLGALARLTSSQMSSANTLLVLSLPVVLRALVGKFRALLREKAA
ncbi:DUF6541 family protein [Arthrobacter sp. TMN-37]